MKLQLANKIRVTGDVWSYYFTPLEKNTWIAGQSIRIELPRINLGYEEKRFTIASAPHEGHMQITTRMSNSPFKQLLERVRPEHVLDAYNIEGDFIWDTPGPKLCIATGTAITPFRALVLNAKEKNSLDDVILLHRGKDKPAIFQAEFEDLAATTPSFSYHRLASRLNINLLNELAPDWQTRQIYLAGSAPVIKDVLGMLVEHGMDEKHIKTDIFTGEVS